MLGVYCINTFTDMQITEQIIERISRKVFNEMFSPALRQSNVVMGGSGSSVSWADNAGHANSADTASSASSVPWSGVADKPAYATRWPSWTEVTSKPTSKTIWGQTYLDASSNFQNVSGALSSVTDLTMSGKLKIGNIYIEAQTDYIEIYRLNDQNEKIDASLCAYGGVSALGVGTGGGGGGGTSLQAVWTAMGNATEEQINISHLATALTGYATQQWVGQQGYITASGSCNYATSAGSSQKVTPLDGITYGAAWLQYKDKHADEASNPANAIGNPTADWYHHIVMNHGNSGGYFVDMALCFHSNAFYYRRIVNGTANDWVRVLDSGNSSVSKSGSTLTVKINGTERSLTDTNTWRPVVDNLTSTDTDKSLSANQGKVLNDKFANYLPLAGGTMTGVLTLKGNQYSGNYGMNANNSDIVGLNALQFADLSDDYTESIRFPRTAVQGVVTYDTIRAADGTFYFGFASGSEFITMTGSMIKHERTDNSSVIFRAKNTNGSISLDCSTNRGVYDDTGGGWLIATNGTNTWLSRGNVGIGTTSPSYKLHVDGVIYSTNYIHTKQHVVAKALELTSTGSTSGNGGYIDFHFNDSSADYTSRLIEETSGTVKLYGNFLATGGVTCLSDIRKKDVIEREVKLSIDDIANAPLIYYTLKGENAHKVRLGSVAQYWANILPETVNKGADGVLSMQYDVQALTSVIALAREVKRLKEEVERLKKN